MGKVLVIRDKHRAKIPRILDMHSEVTCVRILSKHFYFKIPDSVFSVIYDEEYYRYRFKDFGDDSEYFTTSNETTYLKSHVLPIKGDA